MLRLIFFGILTLNVAAAFAQLTNRGSDVMTTTKNLSYQQQQQQQLNTLTNDNVKNDTAIITRLKLHAFPLNPFEAITDDYDVEDSADEDEEMFQSIELTNSTRLSDLLNLFDLNYLSQRWMQVKPEISTDCYHDMQNYMLGLRNGSIWAMKMDDASGHYTSGFYYGNNYMVGSLSQCRSIYNENMNKRQNLMNKRKILPGFSKSYQLTYNENPPFLPGFFVVKMLLNETYPVHTSRNIFEGLCLPSSCSKEDVQLLTKFAQHDLETRSIQILKVLTPTNPHYNLYQDKIFIIVAVVTSIVSLLILSGTLYEIYLRRRLQSALHLKNKDMMNNSEASSGIGYASSSDYGDSVANVSEHKENNLKKATNVILNLPQMNNKSLEKSNNEAADEFLENDLQEPKKLGVYMELLLSFSVITNVKAICDGKVGADTLASIHGLRAISMGWVIMGHTSLVIYNYSQNLELRTEVQTGFLYKIISNAPFSVDTFFFISGCLVSYLYFRTDAKGKLNKLSSNNEVGRCAGHFFGLIIYRFLRLTAPYMLVLGLVQITHRYWEATSIFEMSTPDHLTCSQYWWRNLLYINTLFPINEMCMAWSWYLANDTQFYIVGAIILIIAVRHFKISAVTTCVLLVLSWIITATIAFSHNHRPNIDDPFALFDKIYDKPWTRSGPYLIGMAVGWILFRTNCKIRLPRLAVVTAWVSACLNLLILVFGLHSADYSQFTAALYSSLSHSTWALSLAWITIACSTGYGGYINNLLSAPFMYPFSRVTYCAYLVHPLIIRSVAMTTDAPLHLGSNLMAIYYLGMFMASYLLAFVISVSFEAPVVTMLKILSPSRKKTLT